jgi:hypothetical protein
MPNVPDRGGRTGELHRPPPDMPIFMKRKVANNAKNQRFFEQQQHNQPFRNPYHHRKNKK